MAGSASEVLQQDPQLGRVRHPRHLSPGCCREAGRQRRRRHSENDTSLLGELGTPARGDLDRTVRSEHMAEVEVDARVGRLEDRNEVANESADHRLVEIAVDKELDGVPVRPNDHI